MRLFCKGRVVEKWDAFYQQVRAKMASENGDSIDITGARAIIVLKVQKIQTSCGFALPQFSTEPEKEQEFDEDEAVIVGENTQDALAIVDHETGDDGVNASSSRETLDSWARKQVERRELGDFQKAMNHRSLDGLPGMMSARRAYDENIAVEDTKAWFRKVSRQQDAVALGFGLGVVFMLVLSLAGVIRIEPTFLTHILNLQRRQMGLPEDDTWRKTEL